MPGSASRLSPLDLTFVVLAVLIWGLGFAPTKWVLGDFTPFQLGTARFLLAAFPLVLFLPRPNIPVKWLFLYGFTQGVGQFGMLFFALKVGMSAGLASVLMQTQIFITALLGATLLGESIAHSLKIGMTIAGIGLLCFAANILLDKGLGSITATGFTLTMVAATMWACSNIVVKKLQATGLAHSALSMIAWSSLISGIVFGLISLLFDAPSVRWNWLHASATAWLSVLYLGWLASALAYWLWTVLLTRHPASRVAPFSLGVPVVGLVAGILMLDEQVTTLQWVGSGLVMSALVFVVFSSRFSFERMERRYGSKD